MLESGILSVHKPTGISSFDVLRKIGHRWSEFTGLKKRALPALGHGGTLDPFAEGLLPVCIGEATKLSRFFLGGTKTYTGIIRWGVHTYSGDLSDPVIQESTSRPRTSEAIQEAAQTFVAKNYLQTPPMVSAKKIQGKKLYELARQGIEVEREAVPCLISEFQIQPLGPDEAQFRVVCSSGTYIRVLAQDLAIQLGTIAALKTLVRTQVGGLKIESAVTLDTLPIPHHHSQAFTPLADILCDAPTLRLTCDETLWLRQGKQEFLAHLSERISPAKSEAYQNWIRALDPEGHLVGILNRSHGTPLIERMMAHSQSASVKK
jgi:tRNA pseudouridine55 synthase